MKRKHKLIIIILVSGVFTYLIYALTKDEKLRIVALGDGIASGETAYKIDGISYNDYIKEYFENKKLLKHFSSDYAYKNNKLTNLIQSIEENNLKYDDLNIKQLLNKADIITLSIGEEELVKLAITNDLTNEYIQEYIRSYGILLSHLKDISEAKIFVVGFYENEYLNKSNTIILNSELANIVLKYNANFINISDIMLDKEYINNQEYYFNYKGHKIIAEMILNSL